MSRDAPWRVCTYPLTEKPHPVIMINLSGKWLGTYWQFSLPINFEMVLLQNNSEISGNILDPSHLGKASLSGSLSPSGSINFTKRYLSGVNQAITINYRGTISDSGNFIRGRWSLGSSSGNWEARRIS